MGLCDWGLLVNEVNYSDDDSHASDESAAWEPDEAGIYEEGA